MPVLSLQPQDDNPCMRRGRLGLDIGEIQVQSDQDAPLCPDTSGNDRIVRFFQAFLGHGVRTEPRTAQ
jgi:hypothetical protein